MHGALYHILANRIYVGEIVHRGRSHPGQHPAIITAEVFEAAQRKLLAGAPSLPEITSKGHMATLLGKLFDDSGSPMTSAHANKGQRRYLSYVSTAHTQRKPAGSLRRVSAPRLEQLVTEIVTPLLDPHFAFSSEAPATSSIRRIELRKDRLSIELSASCVARSHFDRLDEDTEFVRVERAHNLARPSTARRLLSADDSRSGEARVDRALVRGIVQARRWQAMLASGEATSIQDIATRERICPIYTGQLLPLSFLAPDLIEGILDGRQPARLSLISLIEATIPERWNEQRELFARYA